MTLLSLGYAFNSEDPQELAAVEQRLLALRPAIRMLDPEASAAVPELLSGEVTILHGYAEDYQMAKAANPAVSYVLPAEGTALWGDSYVIPANSPHRHTAEVLINFLLRPDVVAAEVNEKKYAHPNEAAFPLINPEILDDPVIYPRNEDLQQGQIILPLSADGERRYAEIWKRFLEPVPPVHHDARKSYHGMAVRSPVRCCVQRLRRGASPGTWRRAFNEGTGGV